MDVKVIILCIESALLVILIIGFIAACASALKWHAAYWTIYKKTKGKNGGTEEKVQQGVDKVSAEEPAGYLSGFDRFLDSLTTDERIEFYKNFIDSNRCGLQYKAGGNNDGFFSGVFINLSSVRYVVSDSLMHKICEEYDRLRGMPVTADNK